MPSFISVAEVTWEDVFLALCICYIGRFLGLFTSAAVAPWLILLRESFVSFFRELAFHVRTQGICRDRTKQLGVR